ncbi:hypothetical protein [Burkholderia phage BCSR5]|nr:hypothetical protein [Burkholderia phage BCSR5]
MNFASTHGLVTWIGVAIWAACFFYVSRKLFTQLEHIEKGSIGIPCSIAAVMFLVAGGILTIFDLIILWKAAMWLVSGATGGQLIAFVFASALWGASAIFTYEVYRTGAPQCWLLFLLLTAVSVGSYFLLTTKVFA